MKLPLYRTFQAEHLVYERRATVRKRLKYAGATTCGCHQGGVSSHAIQKQMLQLWQEARQLRLQRPMLSGHPAYACSILVLRHEAVEPNPFPPLQYCQYFPSPSLWLSKVCDFSRMCGVCGIWPQDNFRMGFCNRKGSPFLDRAEERGSLLPVSEHSYLVQ